MRMKGKWEWIITFLTYITMEMTIMSINSLISMHSNRWSVIIYFHSLFIEPNSKRNIKITTQLGLNKKNDLIDKLKQNDEYTYLGNF